MLTDEFKSGACHAGQFETSIVMARRPTAVREEIRPGFAWQAAAGYASVAAVFLLIGWWQGRAPDRQAPADGMEL